MWNSRFVRFLVVGGAGFLIDGGLTFLLTQAELPPWLARIPAMFAAMVCTWLANRQFTYEVIKEKTAGEAIRYATVALTMALLNYAIFLTLVNRNMPPLPAVVISTALQALLSYWCYRNFVFEHRE